jgi:UDP-N-acetylglucosamine 2-epimerase (non-hydrolysing)
MKKILIVIGTRPEAIKMVPLYLELKKRSSLCNVILCVTGQHREMLDQVFNFFNVLPDIDLNIMERNQSLQGISLKILQHFSNVLRDVNPNLVLVHGDTTSAMISSIVCFYEKIELGHVEAGLRTRNNFHPWPEEVNRRIISITSRYNFCPTSLSKHNLLRESIDESTIHVTGNTVIDALLFCQRKIFDSNGGELSLELSKKFSFISENKRVILVTGHRRENFGKGFIEICNALKEIARANNDVHIVYPVHLNPKVKEPVISNLGNISNISLIEPQDYVSFIYLLSNSHLVLTDSGGVQEEAPSLGKPVLVMRETTERPEAVKAGVAKIVGAKSSKIIIETSRLLSNEDAYYKMSRAKNPYGDGSSSKQIADIIFSN